MDNFWEEDILIYTNEFDPLLGEPSGKPTGTWMKDFMLEGMYILLPYNLDSPYFVYTFIMEGSCIWGIQNVCHFTLTSFSRSTDYVKIEWSFHDYPSFSITIEPSYRLTIFGQHIDHGGYMSVGYISLGLDLIFIACWLC